MNIIKTYEWRELTPDGLLTRPRALGPHYDLDETLRDGSWTMESDAVAAFVAWVKNHGSKADRQMVLVTQYEVSPENDKGLATQPAPQMPE